MGEANVAGSIEEMTEKVLKLKEDEYKNLVLAQQEKIKNYTYKNSLENIFRSFEKIKEKYEKNN